MVVDLGSKVEIRDDPRLWYREFNLEIRIRGHSVTMGMAFW